MANVITSLRTYKTVAAAQKRLETVLQASGLKLTDTRWFIGVAAQDEERFVPCLLGAAYIPFAHQGIMVVS